MAPVRVDRRLMSPVLPPLRTRREAWMWAAILLALPPSWYSKGAPRR